ncbi:MAG: DUF3006 domain-containing protein [Clostridiales bacterium]|nr:DUF3006 domain-containing protein [Clostridiales bacterium]
MEYIIDRFEGNFAVCQNTVSDEIKNVESGLIPKGAEEGDVIVFTGDKYFLDSDKTKERKKVIEEKFNSLWK